MKSIYRKMKPARMRLAWLTALALALCAPGFPALAEEGSPAQAATAIQTEAVGGALTLDDAKALALEAAKLAEGDVVITKLEEDYDDGRREFEVEFIAGGIEYEYEIDAETGSIRKSSTETVRGRMKDIESAQRLTLEEAKTKAIEAAGVSAQAVTVTGIQLEYDDGLMVYEVDLSSDTAVHEIELNAATGDVLGYSTRENTRRK